VLAAGEMQHATLKTNKLASSAGVWVVERHPANGFSHPTRRRGKINLAFVHKGAGAEWRQQRFYLFPSCLR